jgi:SAM-dependent methyltransferase
LSDESRRGTKVGQEVLKKADAVQRQVSNLGGDVHGVREEVRALRRELHDRMLQYHFQLGRLARAVDHTSRAVDTRHADGETPATDVRLSGRAVPVAPPAPEEAPWSVIGEGPHPDPRDEQWQVLESCPVCGHRDRTVVCPWNKFILLDKAPDTSSVRYDYAVCHACGVLFASRRPVADRYRFLLEHFGEVTAKRGSGGRISNLVLNPEPLTDAGRAALRQLAARGVFVSDHLGLRKSEYLAPLLRDRFENSAHTDIIGALLAPRGWRVLEVRSRAGTILDGLHRAWGAHVFAMPIWESQQFLLREVYGIETSDLIDFERFAIPFDGPFDLIICNHMLTHALRPRDFFAELRAKLRPGGHLYLHNEPDDAEFLEGNQSMLATLNPLHMQAFDQAALARGLGANGFRAVFQKHQQNEAQFCLATLDAAVFTPQTDPQRAARVDAYRRAFDSAALRVDEAVRPRLAGAWAGVVERAVASGVAEFDAHGQLRIVAK